MDLHVQYFKTYRFFCVDKNLWNLCDLRQWLTSLGNTAGIHFNVSFVGKNL